VLYEHDGEEALALNVPELPVGGEATALGSIHALKDGCGVLSAVPSYFYL